MLLLFHRFQNFLAVIHVASAEFHGVKVMSIKGILGHAIRDDCLLNLKSDAITPHSPTIHERARAQTCNAHVNVGRL